MLATGGEGVSANGSHAYRISFTRRECPSRTVGAKRPSVRRGMLTFDRLTKLFSHTR
jgi:hypothetical protein